MKPPCEDLENRKRVWDHLQMIFMDTDPALELPGLARVCAASPYSVDELEAILFNEVLPACRFNMFDLPAPEWAGFNLEWLTQRILVKHRFGRRKPFLLRRYTRGWWLKLKPLIEQERARGSAAEHRSGPQLSTRNDVP